MIVYPRDRVMSDREYRKHIRNLMQDETVKHHETCPFCGRKLVNVYLKDGGWKCKKCFDKEANNYE